MSRENKISLSDKFWREFFRALGNILPKSPIGDRIWSWCHFFHAHGRFPRRSLKHSSYVDFMYFMKISNELKKPIRGYTSDKADVKKYVRAQMGDEMNIPSLAVLNTSEEIDSYQFPRRCVIKPTHGSGEVILRKDGEPIDRGKLKGWLIKNKYHSTREAQYKYLVPRIIIEDFVFDQNELLDYKFFCKNGKVKFIEIHSGRFVERTSMIYSARFEPMHLTLGDVMTTETLEKPKNFRKMIDVAQILAAEFSFVRIDLYTNGKDIKLGEITHYPGNNRDRVLPAEKENVLNKQFFN